MEKQSCIDLDNLMFSLGIVKATRCLHVMVVLALARQRNKFHLQAFC